MDPASFVVAEQAVSTTVEGAAIAGYGLAQSTQPLSATFTQITSEAFLPRSHHSISVVAGKAYIFGGKDADGHLADTDVHIVRLPLDKSSNEGEADYKCVPALGQGDDSATPGPRYGHAACGIGHRMYLYGGRNEKEILDEGGRIWVFDTESLHWGYLDPSDTSHPPTRYSHGFFASQYPLPNGDENVSFTEQIKSTLNKVPIIAGKVNPPREPHGSLIICSGISPSDDILADSWVFTIATQTWSSLPATPHLKREPNLAFANDTLYFVGDSSDVGNDIHFLQLEPSAPEPQFPDLVPADSKPSFKRLKGKTPQWQTHPFPTNPLAPGPQPRTGAGFLPITTGNGRLYLLYFLGTKVASFPSASSDVEKPLDPDCWSDTWIYQTPALDTTPSILKDKTRSLMGISTGE
ncbi:MAG: hypothetical protein Q9190_001075, partial [Brigantiaea leucoxantha]